jgi:glucokinase
LMQKYKHVSYERVCSGIGISNIYNFFKDSGRAEEPAWLAREMENTKDPTPLIIKTALKKKKSCFICEATLVIFMSLLGAEAGNMALKTLPTGGGYLGGGIPPRILSELQKRPLMENFLQKGRMSRLLLNIPVNVILKTDAAFTGAACYGLEIL